MKWTNASKSLTKPFTSGGIAKNAGMTIIEILIVMGLLGTIMGILLNTLVDRASDANIDATRLGMGQVFQGMQAYKIHNFKYPTTAQGLRALVERPGSGAKRWRGPYMDESKLNDAWGYPLDYESDGRTFKIISAGIDNVAGNEDDIYYPDNANDDSQ